MNITNSVQTVQSGSQALTSVRSGADTGDVPVRQTVEQFDTDSYIPGDTPSATSTTENRGEDTRTDGTRRDEFVPTPTPSGNALYNVADVQRDPDGRIIRTASANPASLHGEQVSGKITDIILSMGRKSLSIFRIED